MCAREICDEITLGAHEATTRGAVLCAAARAAKRRYPRVDVARLAADLEARERAGSTRVGEHVALPHASAEGLDEPLLLDLDLPARVDWDGPRSSGVTRCVVVLVPADQPEAHLSALAEAARRIG